MQRHLPKLSNRHRKMVQYVLAGVVVIALIGAIIFGIRAADSSRRWKDHPPEEIAAWMSPRFIAMSHHVPPDVIEDAIAPGQDLMHRKVSLEDIAEEQGVAVETLILQLNTAIATHQDRKRD